MIDEEDELNELLGQGPDTCAIDGCSNPPYDDVVYIQGVAVAVCHRHFASILMIVGESYDDGRTGSSGSGRSASDVLRYDDIGEDISSEDVLSEGEVLWGHPGGGESL